MNPELRRALFAVPGARVPYLYARKMYNRFRVIRRARKYFSNASDYRKALLEPEEGKIVTLYSKDGLQFTVRKNYMDANILGEIFLDREYVRGLCLPPAPVIVDIGGYIGDFSIFAARYLQAARVVVVEPSPENWKLLTRNVAANNYTGQISALQMAVTEGGPLLLDVDAPERGQAMVSEDFFGKPKSELKEIPGISLAKLVEDFGLDVIDLLKIDCEGGEYTILLTAPSDVFGRVKNLVFEFHEIPGFLEKLDAVKTRLLNEGFRIRTHGHLLYGSRS